MKNKIIIVLIFIFMFGICSYESNAENGMHSQSLSMGGGDDNTQYIPIPIKSPFGSEEEKKEDDNKAPITIINQVQYTQPEYAYPYTYYQPAYFTTLPHYYNSFTSGGINIGIGSGNSAPPPPPSGSGVPQKGTGGMVYHTNSAGGYNFNSGFSYGSPSGIWKSTPVVNPNPPRPAPPKPPTPPAQKPQQQ